MKFVMIRGLLIKFCFFIKKCEVNTQTRSQGVLSRKHIRNQHVLENKLVISKFNAVSRVIEMEGIINY